MTENLRTVVNSLYGARISHHAGHKAFIGSLKHDYYSKELTLKQIEYVQKLLYRYRKQFRAEQLETFNKILDDEINALRTLER